MGRLRIRTVACQGPRFRLRSSRCLSRNFAARTISSRPLRTRSITRCSCGRRSAFPTAWNSRPTTLGQRCSPIRPATVKTSAGGAAARRGSRIRTDLFVERSVATYNDPNLLNLAYTYKLPFGQKMHWGSSWKGVTNVVLGGWETTGIWTFDTGQPLPITWPAQPHGPQNLVAGFVSVHGVGPRATQNLRMRRVVVRDVLGPARRIHTQRSGTVWLITNPRSAAGCTCALSARPEVTERVG